MLKSLRDGAKSIPMRIFLLALVAGFAMWGIDDVFRNVGSNDDAVIAGDIRISAIEAATEFDRTRRAYLPQSNNAEAVAQGMLGDVLAGLARRAIYSAEAERLNLTVTREMEKQHIANEPSFHDDFGRFSLFRFQDTLSQVGLSEDDYLAYINNELQRNQILDAVLPGITYPESLSAKIAAWRLERRRISYVEINIDAEDAATPTDDELDAWYADNSESYDSADLRAVTVLVLSPDILLDDVTVSEAELKDAYDARQDDFTTPEYRDIRQMVFATIDDANEAVSRIKSGASFAEIAAEFLDLDDEDTRLGQLSVEDLTEELSAPSFAAAAGQVVGPIETALGLHVLMVDEVIPSTTVSFDDAREALAINFKRETATDLVYSRIAVLEDSLASGATLEEAAIAAGAEVMNIAGMDRNGRDIDGNTLDGIAADTKFRQSVWTAQVGVDSLVEETDVDTFYALRVNSESESATRPLADLRARVIADIKTERAIASTLARAEKLTTADDLTQGAKSDNLKIIESSAMRRDGVSFDHKAARIIANKAFTLDLDETAIVETGDQAVVIRVDEIISAEGDSLNKEALRMQDSLAANVAASLEGVIAAGLAEIIDVRINTQSVQNLLIGHLN
jgi:peptidyl-prolyl cis-trans isomerase D